MKNTTFWELVDKRAKENVQISMGGLPNSWASVMEWVGLKFLSVGGVLSFFIASLLWFYKYDSIMRFVRVIVWR